MRRRLPFVALAAVIAALVIALVVTQTASRRSDRELSGTIEAYEVKVTSKVSARVVGVRCEEGQAVKTGDTLMLLDASDYRNAARSAGELMSATEALRAAAIGRAELAESSLARLTRLRDTGGVSQQDMDNAQTNALTQRELAAAALASVGNYGAQYDMARARADDCVITAPISGTVSAVAFRPGETVLAGSVPVTIIDLSQTWLTVYLPERLLGRVKLGDTCRARIDAYPKKNFRGTLTFIADKAEFTPKDIQTKEERINQVYRVKITLPNPDRILKPGMPADAYLDLH